MKEIVQALRCTSTPGDHTSNCEQCPYWKKEQLNGRLKEKLGTDTWTSCDIDKVGLDAADLIERLTAENAALREKVPQWISVEDRLPEPETDVLIVCNRNGYVFVTPAIYEDGKMLTQESAWNWSDIYEYGLYSEEDDDYYIPEGWWENRQFNPDDVYNNPVDCTVTHWMPLPGAPDAPAEGGKHE